LVPCLRFEAAPEATLIVIVLLGAVFALVAFSFVSSLPTSRRR